MVGMSYRQKPLPLLSRVNGKERFNLEQKVPDEAPPIGSSDEENDLSTRRGTLKGKAKTSDSESDSGSRGQITKTTFSATITENSRERGSRNSSAHTRLSRASETRDESSPATKRRRLDDASSGSKTYRKFEPSSSSAEHLKDKQGFTKRKVAKQKYGQKPSGSQESQSRKIKSKTLNEGSRLKAPPSVDDLDSPRKSGKAKIRRPSDASLSSPPKNSPVKRIKYPKDENDESDDVPDSPVRRLSMRETAAQIRSRKRSGNIWKTPKPPKSPKVKFMKPAELSSFTHGSSVDDDDQPKSPRSAISELSDLSDQSNLSDFESLEDSQSAAEASQPIGEDTSRTTTECPWCGDDVQEALLKEFSKGKRLNVRMQSSFCQKHKKQTALDTWRERRYPNEILWSDLKSRFDNHHHYLLKVVGGEPSHFRSILANKIETGQARNLRKEHNLNPGYYGPRGFNIMCDYLVGEFSDMLKEKAVSDRVIAGRGSAAFIESVLVAELAVRLIQEDMNVSVEEARNILEESKPLGDIIHEDV